MRIHPCLNPDTDGLNDSGHTDAIPYLSDGRILFKGDVKRGLGAHTFGLYIVDPAVAG